MKRFKSVFYWLGVTVFLFVFQLIYNHFGHGVESVYMNTAWLVGLVALVIHVLYALRKQIPSKRWLNFWRWFNISVWSVAFAQIVIGILAIAGTSSNLVIVYYVFAAILLIPAIVTTVRTA
jgi:hypothetical protein